MKTLPPIAEMRRAHVARDPSYNGLFFVGVRTTGISGAFLLWAARGQALAPVHDLLAAAVAGDAAAAESAARALGGIGHSSGADFAQGLSWGLAGDVLCEPRCGFRDAIRKKP